MSYGLHIEKLGKVVRQRTVLRDINLELQGGDFFMLLGENGAGKTTLFRCLLGLTRHSGAVRVTGAGGSLAPARAGFAPVLEHAGFFRSWSVKANIDYQLNSTRAHDRPLIKQLVSPQILRSRTSQLSTGQRKLVQLAIALSSDAPVLLLDEFANGLDFGHRKLLREEIQAASRGGRIILATGHELETFDGLPTRVAKLSEGSLQDVSDEYIQSGHLRDIYETPPH